MMKNRKELQKLWELIVSRAVAALASAVLIFTVANTTNATIDLTSFLNIISFTLLFIAFSLLISSLFAVCFSSKSIHRFKDFLEPLWVSFILLSLVGIFKSAIDNPHRSILVVLAFVFLLIFLVSMGLNTLQMRPHFKPTDRVRKIKYLLNISFALGFISMLLSIAQANGKPAFGVNILILVTELFCAVLLVKSMIMISKLPPR
jgi:hypothetical protein